MYFDKKGICGLSGNRYVYKQKYRHLKPLYEKIRRFPATLSGPIARAKRIP